MSALEIEPVARLVGHIAVPGDKSISHRAVLLGAICDDETRVTGFGRSADTEATIAAVRALGVEVEEHGTDTLLVRGKGLAGLAAPPGPIDCANAGTLVRLLTGILAGQQGAFTLTGDGSLSRRPMARIAEPLGRMGARVETTDGHLPLAIEGGSLHAIDYALPVASAQVKSAVLLAGLYADGETTVVEPAPTKDHTERMLAAAGAPVTIRPTSVTIARAERLSLGQLEVPGDFSSAAPFLVAATLVPGSELHVHGVNLNPRRTGLLAILERMGARITTYNRREVGGEPAGDLEVHTAALVGTVVGSDEVPVAIDELPLFALAAACARGESVLRGAEELRAKEWTGSTRPSTPSAPLASAPERRTTGSASRASRRGRRGDASRAAGTTGSRCSARSPGSSRGRAYASTTRMRSRSASPASSRCWTSCGARRPSRRTTGDNLRRVIVAIDGPAGAGKSSVARALATRLGFKYLDTGAMYRALTWLALHEGVPLDDGLGLSALATANPVAFGDGGSVSIGGEEVARRIREPEIDAAVPVVARHPEVREVMRGRQRELGHTGDSVIEGRDIGVVVVPEADVKVWLVADPGVRVTRRHAEREGLGVDELAEELRRRDERDAVNTHQAPDAVEVDTTELTLDEVVDRVAALVAAAR